MSDEDIIELGLVLHSMFGFVHGYLRLKAITDPTNDGSPEQSFYLNALRTMCVNYFIGTSPRPSDVNIRNVLEHHSLHHLVHPIDELLGTELGSTTFKSILTKYRNKFLTHELFQVSNLDNIHDQFNLRRHENWLAYHVLEQRLFNETTKLFYDLRERYPGAWLIPEDLRS
ncbi:MAG: hypothetical protein OXG65_09360 [Chloroflexi bacterium]|nr:hypothetical protein [Chloroflexota bacterium]